MPGGANATINHVKGAGDPAAVFGNRSKIFRAAGARSTRRHLEIFQTRPKGKTRRNRNGRKSPNTRDKLGVVRTKINFCAHSSEGNRAARAGKIRLVHALTEDRKATLPLHDPLSTFRPQRLKLPRKPINKDSENRSSKTRPGISTRDAQKVGRKNSWRP